MAGPACTARARMHLARRLAVSALSLALICAGCDSHEEDASPMAPPQVTVMPPVRQEITDWDEFTGRFVSTERIELRARVSGYLDAIAFADGQVVRRGDMLFRIDPRPFEAAVAEAEARLVGLRSQVTLAEREFDRAKNLLQYRAASEANLEQRNQALEAARAQVAQGEATLQRARLDLEFTRIRAPVTGRIGRHLVSPGNLVSGGEASTATLLATIVTMDPIDVVFDIDQAAALRYVRLAESGGRPSSRDAANPVQLALADETAFPHHGRVVFVDNEADPGTGTIRLRARFENPRDLFVPGIFARVRLVASQPYQALLVPDAAVATDQSRRVLYVLGPGDTLEARQVALGPLHGDMRVIRDGLRGDEEIVVNGLMRARAGQAVSPRRPVESGGRTVSEARP
ncbi:efflux RND transporter periplasmic adaptor subunit [Paracraurococcus lichenis]|uniref:Efflux RND transporter periplasmic adaptor subunit n=1 Tax=Paracraurococcus lichenis TaxID=3064888 RepID=A0ABT9E6V6_9PROT|nr:efflux RND transporter periplasmic adaptor subunit [Paracraurococcus sp. LOR1-02]MDO9711871.1 efflux RND transporter periplasmic adaptor subunit [Paracraurococcus sp. LOR1-02]